jgi:hypothetical protein
MKKTIYRLLAIFGAVCLAVIATVVVGCYVIESTGALR